MEYRTLAHTDLTLSAITFGSWAAGGWMWGTPGSGTDSDQIRYEMGCSTR